MSDNIEYVKPKNPPQKTNPQDMDEKEREAFIKDYAEYLDILKQTQPEEYAKIVRELQEAAQGEFKAKLPGGKGYMGEKGIAQDEDYEKVTPEEAFVVKTNNMETNDKVFLNICTHTKVGMFSRKKQLDAEGNEQEGLNIPLSLGSEHKEEDNKGNLCSTYDIIVNPEVVIESSKDISFKHFVIDLSLGYVEQKYKLTLNHQYKLPKLKYKGKEIQPQYIRKKKSVVIEEVDENSNKSKTITSSSSSSTKPKVQQQNKPLPVSNVLEDLKYTIHYYKDTEQMLLEDLEQCDYQDQYTKIPDYFILEFQLIPSIKLKDINLKYNLTSIVINIRNYKKCEVNIPYVLLYNAKDEEKKHKLFFNSTSHQFTGKFFIDSEYYTNFDSIDIGSKEWILQQALSDDNDKSDTNISKEIQEMNKTSVVEEVTNDVDQDTPYNGESLPEDKFHKTDLLSQHYNQERDAGVQRQKEKSNKPLMQEEDEEIKNLQPIPVDVPIEFSNDLSDMIL